MHAEADMQTCTGLTAGGKTEEGDERRGGGWREGERERRELCPPGSQVRSDEMEPDLNRSRSGQGTARAVFGYMVLSM